MRVLIVDDSAFMRKVLSDMVTELGFDVAGTAKNGREAIDMVSLMKPDVVTLDIEMPIMNGLDALSIIMKEHPTPVVMLSTLTMDGAEETLKALELGAVDFMTKPTSIFKVQTKENLAELKFKLEAAANSSVTAKLKMLSRMPKLKKQPRMEPSKDVKDALKDMRLTGRLVGELNRFKKLVAIGTSTGGPMALQEVISHLPAQLNAAVVVVQHMPAKFTKSLADRLDSLSDVSVKEAEHGEMLKRGTVYIAPGDKHMLVVRQFGGFMIELSDSEKINSHRPSVDLMMNSVAELGDIPTVGVIMTGMGNDGTIGLTRMKQEGAYVISQDESTCVVFGMPGSAIKAGVVDKVAKLENIAGEIKKAVED